MMVRTVRPELQAPTAKQVHLELLVKRVLQDSRESKGQSDRWVLLGLLALAAVWMGMGWLFAELILINFP